jgi:hypothetical protein
MKKELRSLYFLIITSLLLDLPRFALAQGSRGAPAEGTDRLTNPLGETSTLTQLLEKVLNIMVQLGLPIIVLAYVWAGFKYVTAFGDAKKVGEATEIFKWTTVGAGVLLGAKTLALLIKGTVDQLK